VGNWRRQKCKKHINVEKRNIQNERKRKRKNGKIWKWGIDLSQQTNTLEVFLYRHLLEQKDKQNRGEKERSHICMYSTQLDTKRRKEKSQSKLRGWRLHCRHREREKSTFIYKYLLFLFQSLISRPCSLQYASSSYRTYSTFHLFLLSSFHISFSPLT